MDQTAFTRFENRTTGFLTGLIKEDSRIEDAVLLTASYETNAFTDTLFDTLDIPCPPNIKGAALKRKADYLAGRVIALAAMSELGVAAAPVATAPSRAPLWPKGLAGSISHARGHCACLLSRNTRQDFGVDAEAIASGTSLAAIQSETLTTKDRVTIGQGTRPTATSATLAFSAKEALFKALYPQVGRFFGFNTAELAAPPSDTQLTLTLTGDLTPTLTKGQSFTLNTSVSETHVLTWLAVPAA